MVCREALACSPVQLGTAWPQLCEQHAGEHCLCFLFMFKHSSSCAASKAGGLSSCFQSGLFHICKHPCFSCQLKKKNAQMHQLDQQKDRFALGEQQEGSLPRAIRPIFIQRVCSEAPRIQRNKVAVKPGRLMRILLTQQSAMD